MGFQGLTKKTVRLGHCLDGIVPHPHLKYVEVLALSILEYDLIWK